MFVRSGSRLLDESGPAVHKAAQDGHFIKAEIDSTDSPMSAVGDYRMMPFPFLRDKPRVANLIPVERTDAPTVYYFKVQRRRRPRQQ
jgi:hypothetical protein